MTEPIPEEVFAQVRRKASRRVAAVLVRCMADTDTGLDVIAKRIGKDEAQVRKWLYDFIDGNGHSLDVMSDLAWSMGAVWELSLEAYTPPRAVDEQELKQAAAA